MTEEWISLREFARRRGVRLAAVQKAIESGRVKAVKRSGSGRLKAIEVIAATIEWDGNTDIDQAARNGKVLGAANPPAKRNTSSAMGEVSIAPATDGQSNTPSILVSEKGGAAGPDDPPAAAVPEGSAANGVAAPPASTTDADQAAYYSHRAKREEFQAKQAELDYLAALGRVISTAEFEQLATRRYRAIRDTLLNIPDRVATIVAAERDPVRVHSTLTGELKRVLNELADAAKVEAAGGVAERMAA